MFPVQGQLYRGEDGKRDRIFLKADLNQSGFGGSLKKESFGEIGDAGFDVGEGFGGGGEVEVVHMPEFDAVGPVGEAGVHEGAVFGFLESDDVGGGGEVGTGEVLARGGGVVKGDAALEEALAGLGREVVVHEVNGEAAGKGAPRPIVGPGEMVEAGFGEAAAVVVAGAEEEDVAHGRSIAWSGRGAKQKRGGDGKRKMEDGKEKKSGVQSALRQSVIGQRLADILWLWTS